LNGGITYHAAGAFDSLLNLQALAPARILLSAAGW
jgi:hypothetical protein